MSGSYDAISALSGMVDLQSSGDGNVGLNVRLDG